MAAVAEMGVSGDMSGSPPQPRDMPMPKGVPGVATEVAFPKVTIDGRLLPMGVDGCEDELNDDAGKLIFRLSRNVKPPLAGVLGTAKPPTVAAGAGEELTGGPMAFRDGSLSVDKSLSRIDEALYATAAAPSVFWINLLSEASTSLALASFLLTNMSGSLLPLLASSSSSSIPPSEVPYALVGKAGVCIQACLGGIPGRCLGTM